MVPAAIAVEHTVRPKALDKISLILRYSGEYGKRAPISIRINNT